MYESPVKLYMTDVQSQLIKQQEEMILQAVRSVAVGVDHEELFRALRYDRDQYEKGYRDAMNDLVRCKDCKNRDEITKECKHPKAVGWDVIIPEDNDFCSYGERKTENE